MVVAETRGLLRPLRRGDDEGRIRESLILKQLNREALSETVKMRFQRQVAAAQYIPGDTEGKIFDYHWDEARKEMMKYLGHIQPWIDWDAQIERLEQDEYEKDVALWESQWGSLEDPEVQEEIDRLAEALRSGVPFHEHEDSPEFKGKW